MGKCAINKYFQSNSGMIHIMHIYNNNYDIYCVMVLKCMKCSVSALVVIWNVLQVWWSCNVKKFTILYDLQQKMVFK